MAARPFRFLDLPAEIRNKTYRLLLCNFEEPHDFSSDTFVVVPGEITRAKHDINTAILRVNRQVHREARDIFIKENQFIRVEAHFHILLGPAIKGTFITKRVPVITSNKDLINKFKGQVMTYTFEEKGSSYNNSFISLILLRDFDTLCRSIATSDAWMPHFGSKTKHTLVLIDPYNGSSEDHQKQLLAPFRRHLRSLTKVVIRGKVERALANAVIAEVRRDPAEDPDLILQELQDLKDTGAEYFEKGDNKMASESWAKGCIRIIRLRGSQSWTVLRANKPFVDDVSSLFFTLNLNLAKNNINVMEQSTHDLDLVAGIANSALSALQSAYNEAATGGGWQPSPPQMAKLWFRKAKAHRLCEDYDDARQAIEFACVFSPEDPTVLQERTRIMELMR